jgi:hypothetical protein
MESGGRGSRQRRGSIFRRPSEFPAPSQLESAPKQYDQYQCLRIFLKTPRELRIWGTPETRETARECLELLSKVPFLERLDDQSLQKILMYCELVVMRKAQVAFEIGQEQSEAIWLISGTLVLKNGRDDANDEQMDKASNIPVLNAGDTLGFKSLFSDWKHWPFGCSAGSNKVEVTCVPILFF